MGQLTFAVSLMDKKLLTYPGVTSTYHFCQVPNRDEIGEIRGHSEGYDKLSQQCRQNFLTAEGANTTLGFHRRFRCNEEDMA
jgi:hypothetical protein